MYCFLKVLGFSIGWGTVKRHDFIALQLESDGHLLSTTRDCERCMNSREGHTSCASHYLVSVSTVKPYEMHSNKYEERFMIMWTLADL